MEGHTGKSCYLYTAEQVFILKPKMVHTHARIKTVCLFARCVNEVRVHIFVEIRFSTYMNLLGKVDISVS